MTAKEILIAVFFATVLINPLHAEADGPDFWRVEGVANNDTLNIRKGPNPRSEVLGEIPPQAGCIKNLGCTGGLTLKESTTLTDSEKAVVRRSRPRWCHINYEGISGWVHANYIREDSCNSLVKSSAPEPEPEPENDNKKTETLQADTAEPDIPDEVKKLDDSPARPDDIGGVSSVEAPVAHSDRISLPAQATPDPESVEVPVTPVTPVTAPAATVTDRTENSDKEPTEETSQDNIRIAAGWERPRGEFAVDYAPNVEACVDWCLREQRCIAFDYNTKYQACWLKDQLFPVRKNEHFLTGIRERE